MNKQLTKRQLVARYNGKFIEEFAIYNYFRDEWLFEVRSVKNTIHENHNPPEEIISWYK